MFAADFCKEYNRDAVQKLKTMLWDLGLDALHNFHYLRHNVRGNRIRKQYLSSNSPFPPVILIQGFMSSRGVLIPLEKHLRSTGRNVISIDLGFFNLGDIKRSAELLHYKVERILERYESVSPTREVDIIGHSMGGLIGLYYIKRLGGHRLVRRMIALGAPFNGTWSALFGILPFGLFSKGLWQMIPKSDFLQSVKAHPEESHETKIVSVAAKYDAICPPNTCHLPGAENIDIEVGHAGLLMDPKVFECVEEHLSKSRPKHSHQKVVSINHSSNNNNPHRR